MDHFGSMNDFTLIVYSIHTKDFIKYLLIVFILYFVSFIYLIVMVSEKTISGWNQ